jgi:hypothetical protein
MDITTNNSIAKKVPNRGIRYKNDEDKRNGYLESKCRYNSKKWHCEQCDKSYSIASKSRHIKTIIHKQNVENYIS